MKTGNSNIKPPGTDSLLKWLRNRFSVFFIFVIFSSLVWVVIKLSKNFSSSVSYNIEYQNIPEGYILEKTSDTTIIIGMDAQGFNLVKQLLAKQKPVLNIDLSAIRVQKEGGAFSAYLTSTAIAKKIIPQLGSHREFNFLSPDTLRFSFLPAFKKRVPVHAAVSYQLRTQYMLYDSVQVLPDSTWVIGTEELVDTIGFVPTINHSFKDLFENQDITLPLQRPANRLLSYSDPTVQVQLNVEKFTEKSFELPVRIINAESDDLLRIFPEKVTVTCLVALKDYKRIDAAMFDAVVIYKPSEHQASSKLKIELANYPAYVRIARIGPERVEYILVKSVQ